MHKHSQAFRIGPLMDLSLAWILLTPDLSSDNTGFGLFGGPIEDMVFSGLGSILESLKHMFNKIRLRLSSRPMRPSKDSNFMRQIIIGPLSNWALIGFG